MINLLHVAPNLNASVCCFVTTECRTLTQVWQLNTTYVYKPPSTYLRYRFFPYKPAAIVSSTFSEVLFLDCDAYVTRDPEELFLSDPMYLKFGALFYPDALKSRQHPAVWKLFNTSCAENEYELDSAMILVDKKRVWNGLYMTKLMNDHYKTFYKVFYDYYK
jgi:alpha 1,2-mannosyltransferase